MEDATFDLVAASLRADVGDIKSFVEVLATKLSDSFPGHVRVERGGGFLSKTKPVRKIVVDLGENRYVLDHDGGATVCSRSRVVGGVALKNDRLDLDAWIDLLSRSLADEAEASEQGRGALGRFLA